MKLRDKAERMVVQAALEAAGTDDRRQCNMPASLKRGKHIMFKATNDGKAYLRLLVVAVVATLSPDRVAECMSAPFRARWTLLSPGRPSQRGWGGAARGDGVQARPL